MGREEGGGFRMGNTCIPVADSYTEGETLKAKSEGFQEDHMGWFQKEGLLFLPGNLQWKLVNSLHATTHLGEKALQGLLVSRECMFLSSLSRHNKDLERRTLKPSVRQLSGLGQTVLQLLGKSVLQLYFI